MKLLLKSVKIVDPGSKYNGKVLDIHIQDRLIIKIGKNLVVSGTKVLDFKNACVSPGWFDLNVNFTDPGLETKEDILSGVKAAMKGGITGLALMPNTQPPVHSKSEVEYIVNKSKELPVAVFPVGALSRNREGKDIAEMYDMQLSGAVAFSDGNRSVGDAGLMSRALLYAKGLNALLISYAEDASIAPKGKMNEGEMSTLLGIKGIPALAEELMISRDIFLSEYTDAAVHFTSVSTARSAELIRAAKKKGLKVTADVSVNNLFFDESVLSDFDSHYKVKPPLRTKEDVKALKSALKDGTIDAICSQHTPEDIEHKNVEFEIAGYGMIGLQTFFSLSWMSLSRSMELDQLIDKIAIAPRRILGLPVPEIKEGGVADITLFDPAMEWELKEKDIESKSKNTPLTGKMLTGKAIAIINRGKLNLV